MGFYRLKDFSSPDSYRYSGVCEVKDDYGDGANIFSGYFEGFAILKNPNTLKVTDNVLRLTNRETT